MNRTDRLAGVLLGMAVGDSLGLPREGLSARRAVRLYGTSPLRQQLICGRGMISDDTEHACMTAQALLASPDNADGFARSLAWRLRFWLLGLPAAIGWGTLRAIVRLWLGFSPTQSGVRSAGNGAAMRAPILGGCLSRSPDLLAEMVRASTALTHRDARAEAGALAVALAASHAVSTEADQLDGAALLARVRASVQETELARALSIVQDHLARGASPQELAASLGLSNGVSGFINHTVPACLYCWLRYPGDFRTAVEEVILLGGDTDTTAAIVGGLAGGTVGEGGIPGAWLDRLCEWPRSVPWLRRLADRLAKRFPDVGPWESTAPLSLFWPGVLVRNVVFLAIVMVVGLRRLLPPY
jgi:ADP-ribosylglycohydrolase